MKKIGIIFPGQGTQSLGMGKDLYDKHRLIQEYFEEASNCLEQNFVRLCFASSERELKETVNAQTSTFLVSAAIFSLLKSKYNIKPHIVAGHGSGQYTALFAAEGITFADGLYLLKKRALFMDEVNKKHPGSMISVTNVPYNTLQEICSTYDDGTPERVAEIAHINSTTQFVISGTPNALESVTQEIKTYGGKVTTLNVDGAYNSRLMSEVANLFALYLVKVDFKPLTIPLANNVTARTIQTPEEVQTAIKEQITAPIRWRESLEAFADCDIIIEIGSDDTLSNLLAQEWTHKNILAIRNEQDIERLLMLLEKDVVKREHHASCDRENCALEELVVLDEHLGSQATINECSGKKDIVLPTETAPEEQQTPPESNNDDQPSSLEITKSDDEDLDKS